MMDGSDALKLITQRQSDRAYSDRRVEKEKIDRIMEAGRLSPSACNSQPWKFIVVDDPLLVSEMADASSAQALGFNKFTSQVPVFIVLVREKSKPVARIGGAIKDKDYSLIDTGIAAGYICLQAAAEGLGSCMLGWFDEKKVKKVLGIPRGRRAELLITIGYPAGPNREKRRKEPGEVISYNRY